MAVLTAPEKFEKVAVLLNKKVVQRNESLSPYLKKMAVIALQRPVKSLDIDIVQSGMLARACC